MSGHTDKVVCSAISAVIQTALLGLSQIAIEYPDNCKINIERNVNNEIN